MQNDEGAGRRRCPAGFFDRTANYDLLGGRALPSRCEHYLHGASISKIAANLNYWNMPISAGTLVGQWHALAKVFRPLFEEIKSNIHREVDVVHADETGYRQAGRRMYLWFAGNQTNALYLLRRGRGKEFVRELLGDGFAGILCTDFYSAYSAADTELRQFCLAHFLREFKKIESERANLGPEYKRFKKRMKRLLGDAMKFAAQKALTLEERRRRHDRFQQRLEEIACTPTKDPDVRRLCRRLNTHHRAIFNFVLFPGVEPTNNFAERMLRPAVINRKSSFHTMSEQGSETFTILMSVFRTLHIRGFNVYEEAFKLAQDALMDRNRRSFAESA